MNGLFVVFDGIDGSGKGTIISEVRRFLINKGIPENDIVVTAEPTNSESGKKIRELLNSGASPESNAEELLNLYVEDRKKHVEKKIIPALNKGKIILCDRFKHSTFVYQTMQGIHIEKIHELHKGIIVPDVTFILDLSVDVALERVSRRNFKETFEQKDFLEKVRAGFLSLKKTFSDEEIYFINAEETINKVAEKVEDVLWKKLKAQ